MTVNELLNELSKRHFAHKANTLVRISQYVDISDYDLEWNAIINKRADRDPQYDEEYPVVVTITDEYYMYGNIVSVNSAGVIDIDWFSQTKEISVESFISKLAAINPNVQLSFIDTNGNKQPFDVNDFTINPYSNKKSTFKYSADIEVKKEEYEPNEQIIDYYISDNENHIQELAQEEYENVKSRSNDLYDRYELDENKSKY